MTCGATRLRFARPRFKMCWLRLVPACGLFAHACRMGLRSKRKDPKGPSSAGGEAGGRGGLGAVVMAGDPGFWDVAWSWPLPFLTAVATLVVPIVGTIWFIYHRRYKQQIATLEDRVELANERLGDAKEKIAKAEEEKTALDKTVKELTAEVGKLKKRKAQLPRDLQSIVDRLATSSATASNQVSKLTEAQEAAATAVSKHRGERGTLPAPEKSQSDTQPPRGS